MEQQGDCEKGQLELYAIHDRVNCYGRRLCQDHGTRTVARDQYLFGGRVACCQAFAHARPEYFPGETQRE